MGYAHEYLSAIRRRATVWMPPYGWETDKSDLPRRWKFYRDAPLFPLPAVISQTGTANAGTLRDGLFGAMGDGVPFNMDLLSGMLFDSYALVERRLDIDPNDDSSWRPWYQTAKWGRATASGGGWYPVSIYWVSGATGPLPPGIYYYSAAHHAMQCLLTGDVSSEVIDALGQQAPGPRTDQFLVLGIKFWQNACKYASFSFHATTMDIGTVIGTWRLWAGAHGLSIEPSFWFDEQRISRLLGIDADTEGLFAVVPLPWQPTARPAQQRDSWQAAGPHRVRVADSERSRRVVVFDAVRKMQQATNTTAAERPGAHALAAAMARPADGPRVGLPAPSPLDMSPRQALRARRSSNGRFSGARPARADQLAAVLAAAVAGGALACDVSQPGRGLELVKMYAFISHVDGIEPGAYEFCPADNTLIARKPGDPGRFLQASFFLTNYNLEQASAVLACAIRATAVLDALGDTGYRLVNAVVGATAQAACAACAAVGLGCGVALGFDNVSYIEELGLAESDAEPLLLVLVGGERPGTASFRYELS